MMSPTITPDPSAAPVRAGVDGRHLPGHGGAAVAGSGDSAVSSLLVPLNMRLAGLFAKEGADERVAASTRLAAVVLDSFRGMRTLRSILALHTWPDGHRGHALGGPGPLR